MPYVRQVLRDRVDTDINSLLAALIEHDNTTFNDGLVNYSITKLLDLLIGVYGENYANFNRVMGILESVKQEYYRKRIAPYEDEKAKENGEVYD